MDPSGEYGNRLGGKEKERLEVMEEEDEEEEGRLIVTVERVEEY